MIKNKWVRKKMEMQLVNNSSVAVLEYFNEDAQEMNGGRETE